MAQPAAKEGDQIVSVTPAKVYVLPNAGPPPVLTPFSYSGVIDNELSADVFVNGKPAAVTGSTSQNKPTPQEQLAAVGTVQSVVDNTATISAGSATVFFNGKEAARNQDKAKTWDFSTGPSPGVGKEIENGAVVASGNVFIG